MKFGEINPNKSLSELRAWSVTDSFRRKLRASEQIVSDWLRNCNRPAISCGGGKDSVATALIVRAQNKDIPIFCAHPPNPMPGRNEHVEKLKNWFGDPWVDVPYPWDVESVLDRRSEYPTMLKVRELTRVEATCGIDGIALGLRQAESRARTTLPRHAGRCIAVAGY